MRHRSFTWIRRERRDLGTTVAKKMLTKDRVKDVRPNVNFSVIGGTNLMDFRFSMTTIYVTWMQRQGKPRFELARIKAFDQWRTAVSLIYFD